MEAVQDALGADQFFCNFGFKGVSRILGISPFIGEELFCAHVLEVFGDILAEGVFVGAEIGSVIELAGGDGQKASGSEKEEARDRVSHDSIVISGGLDWKSKGWNWTIDARVGGYRATSPV